MKAKAKAALGRGEGIGAYLRRAQQEPSAAVAEAQEDVVEEPVIRSVEMEEEGGGEPTAIDGGEIACDAPLRDALGEDAGASGSGVVPADAEEACRRGPTMGAETDGGAEPGGLEWLRRARLQEM